MATFFKRTPDVLAFGLVPAFRRFELHAARYRELSTALCGLVERDRVLNVLDVGCGNGDSKRFLDASGYRNAVWTGVELDPVRVANALRAGYDNVITSIDLEHQPLPRPENSFDIVVASHILEHLENATESLRHWYELLRPGGVLILGVPMHLGPIAWLATLRYRFRGRRPHGHCHFFSMKSLRELLKPYPVHHVAGFRIFSARKVLPLEDFEWFYKWSTRLGRRWPGLTSEVNAVLLKPALVSSLSPEAEPTASFITG